MSSIRDKACANRWSARGESGGGGEERNMERESEATRELCVSSARPEWGVECFYQGRTLLADTILSSEYKAAFQIPNACRW